MESKTANIYSLKITESEPQVINSKEVFYTRSPHNISKHKTVNSFFVSPIKQKSNSFKQIDEILTEKIKSNTPWESLVSDPVVCRWLKGEDKSKESINE
jgi:hypothetical protein